MAQMTLQRGKIYEFNLAELSGKHPFCLRLAPGDTSPVPGATGNDPVNGSVGNIIRYLVPYDAPDKIIYQCAKAGQDGIHKTDTNCVINIVDVGDLDDDGISDDIDPDRDGDGIDNDDDTMPNHAPEPEGPDC